MLGVYDRTRAVAQAIVRALVPKLVSDHGFGGRWPPHDVGETISSRYGKICYLAYVQARLLGALLVKGYAI